MRVRVHRRRARLAGAPLALCLATASAAPGADLGFPHHPPELRARLAAALAARQPGFDPRTEHLLPDGRPRFTNRLLLEDSPYLRQHAHNPVDWHPWGPAALALAAREDRPIFLSIGYSTCHWCHVMERESFDDLGIAALLAESFVAIKVDREQRPDVDDIYMTAIRLTGRGGGWPLSSFLTPQGRPFFAATYLPSERFAEVLRAVARMWREDRAEIEVTAASLADAVREVAAARAEAVAIAPDAAARAIEEIAAHEDATRGGLGTAPKFPHEPELLLLLDQAARGSGGRAGGVAERALEAMARGGIFDQVGGGFHRYSTDAAWRVPHFEKMLYNQAQLARAYVAGWRLTGRESFRRAAAQVLDYVLRELTSPDGGFYSATDADSEGSEGRFFVWTPRELERALGPEDASWAAALFGVTAEGNFEDGRTVLHLPWPLDQVARETGAPLEATLARLDGVRERLRAFRETRERPLRDDKILTGWNGMMITALVEGSGARDDSGAEDGGGRWLAAAERAGELVWSTARRGPGRLWRVRLDGSSSVEALLEDHACLAEAMLTLYDATGERRWLDRATETLDGMVEQFWDGEAGGFFLGAAPPGEGLIARPKSPQDGATPSGNSVALRALAMAYHRTGALERRDRAEALVVAFSGLLERSPSSFPYLLLGRTELLAGDTGIRRYAARGKVALAAVARQVVVAGSGGGRDALELQITLDLAPGWHVNSFAPLEDALVATRVELPAEGVEAGWRLSDLTYPEPEEVRLGFQQAPLSVYTGRVAVRVRLHPPEGSGAFVPVAVRLQACDDSVCLRPEEVLLRAAVAPLLRPATARF
ncbi:MAG TPA: DUF255 domain-containing protein [Thermoanaerobaculia bacterium]|nr:DUF255 domain-containing protein [Thermoanaerobaculia bacterium]